MPRIEVPASYAAAMEAVRRVIEIVVGVRIELIEYGILADRKAINTSLSHGRLVTRWVCVSGGFVKEGDTESPPTKFFAKVLCYRMERTGRPIPRRWYLSEATPIHEVVIGELTYSATWSYFHSLLHGEEERTYLNRIEVARKRGRAEDGPVPADMYKGTGFSDRQVVSSGNSGD